MAEHFGTGTGNDGSVPGVLVNVVVGTTDIANANFAIEQPPTAVADATTTTQGAAVTLNVTGNDTDPLPGTVVASTVDLDPSTAGIQTTFTNAQGTWTVNATGDVTFTPVPNFVGTAIIPYTVNDAAGGTSSPVNISITVSDVLPVAVNDIVPYTAGSTITVPVLTNDTGDPIVPASVQIVGTTNPGDPLVVTGQGTWSVNPTTGAITFTPEVGYTGTPTPISYSGLDAQGTPSNTATVTLNTLPVAVNDIVPYTAGSTIIVPVLTNDTGDPIVPASVQIVGTTNPGDPLVVTGQGTWSVNPTTGAITFTPEVGYTGTPTPISYSGLDAQGTPSNTATVTLNTLPVAENDIVPYTAGSTIIVPVLTNDTGDPIVPASVQIVGTTNPGDPLVVTGQGTWSVNPTTGAITFTPEVGYTGTPTPISYSGLDAQGTPSNTATVTLNTLPVAVNDIVPYTAGSTIIVPVLTNDTGDPIVPASVQIVGTTNTGDPLVVTGQGTWSVNPTTGAITFTPEVGYTGTPTPISYSGLDAQGSPSNTATVTLNTLPVAVNDIVPYTAGSTITVPVLTNDTGDPIVPASVQIVGTTNPGDPLVVTGQGTWSVNPTTGAITFTPEVGYTGTPTPISYSGLDAQGTPSNTATVTLNTLPVAVNDIVPYTAGSTIIVPVLTNDTGDPIVPASVQIVGTTNPGDPLVVTGQGTWSVNPTTGAITFTPEVGYTGTPTPISYSGLDAQGTPSNTATVTLNTLPVAVNDIVPYTAGSTIIVPVLTNDTGDPIVPASVQIVGTTNPGDPLVVTGQGTWSVNPTTGAITFTPEVGYTGTPTPISYSGLDAQGTPSNTATVTLEPCLIDIGGGVYVDTNGLPGIDGTLLDGSAYDVYMTLWNGATKIAVKKVDATGHFLFTSQPAGTYTLVIGNAVAGSSLVAAPTLTGFTSIGEGGPVISGVSQGDGTIDGKTTITADCYNITYEHAKVAANTSYLDNNFGIKNVGPLPVDLLTFDAKQFEEVVNLTWKTANEKAFSHFELQRSANAKEFGTIASVTGNQSGIYNHADANPIEGINYYRLKMVDADGTSKLSNTISVAFEKGGEYTSVENPVTNGKIKVNTNLVNPHFQLFALNGAKMSLKTNNLSTSN